MSLARVKKGDMVMVMAGRDRGKTGKIFQVLPRKEAVLVEKLNLVKRHTKPNQKSKQGGIVEKEALLHWSKVMPLCPKTHKPTRVSIKVEKENKIRFSVKGKAGFTVEKGKRAS